MYRVGVRLGVSVVAAALLMAVTKTHPTRRWAFPPLGRNIGRNRLVNAVSPAKMWK